MIIICHIINHPYMDTLLLNVEAVTSHLPAAVFIKEFDEKINTMHMSVR